MRIAAKKLITSTTYVRTNFWEDGTTVVSMCFISLYAKLALSGMEIYSFIQPFSEKFFKNVDYSFFPPLFPALRWKRSNEHRYRESERKGKRRFIRVIFLTDNSNKCRTLRMRNILFAKKGAVRLHNKVTLQVLPHENQRPRSHYTQPASHRERKTRVFKRWPIFS